MELTRQTQPRTKVVVRNLPPFLGGADFSAAIEKWLTQTDYFHYVRGKSDNKKTVPSYAFINFKTPEDLLAFTETFSGHIFVDSKGVEYQALVEYAPHQRIPNPPKVADPQAGTLESDLEFQQFVESLKKEVGPLPSAEVQLEQRLNLEKELLEKHGGKKPAIMSPLLQELLEKKRLRQKQSIARASKRENRSERRRRQKDAKDGDSQKKIDAVSAVDSSVSKRGGKKQGRRKVQVLDSDTTAKAGGVGSQKQSRRSGRSAGRANPSGAQTKRGPSNKDGDVWMAILKEAKRDMHGEVSILQKKPSSEQKAGAPDTSLSGNTSAEPMYQNFME